MPVYYKTLTSQSPFVTGAGETIVQVECIGAGASGGCNSSTSGAGWEATGGGGGAYSKATGLNLSGSFAFVVGVGGAAITQTANSGGNNGNDGGDTTFNSTTCGAGGGKAGLSQINIGTNGGAGGTVLNGTGFAGGRGGNSSSNQPQSGSGGGGAGGPDGAGANGVDLVTSHQGTNGGNSDNGSDATGGTGNANPATNGGDGTKFDATHGCGAGGGGQGYTGSNIQAGNGGKYGGGGGGCAAYTEQAISGAGGGGLIIITTTAGSSGSIASTSTVAGVGGAIDMGVGGIGSSSAVAGVGQATTTVQGVGGITSTSTVLGAFAPVSQIGSVSTVAGVGSSIAMGVGSITSTSNPQATVAPTVFSLQLAETAGLPFKIFQEAVTGGLVFTVTGTFVANFLPTNISVQCDVVGGGNVFGQTNLTNIVITGPASNGTFSGKTPVVPAGAFYKFTPGEPSTSFVGTQQTNRFAVGLTVEYYGQSNIGFFFSLGTPAGVFPDAYAYAFGTGSWANYQEDTGTRNGWAHMLAQLRATALLPATYPIGITGTYEGGTPIFQFLAGAPSNNFTNLQTVVNDPNFSPPRIGIWWQGETDEDPTQSAGAYAADLPTVISQVSGLNVDPNYKFGIIIPGVAANNGGSTDAGADIVRGNLLTKALTAGCFYIGCCLDMQGNADYDPETHIALRCAVAILNQLGKVPYGTLGPSIGRVYWPLGSTTMIANITHNSGGTSLVTGDGGTSGANLVGFTLGGTSKTITATAFVGNSIHFTMSAARDGSDTAAVLKHLVGVDPLNQAGNGYTNANNAKLTYDNNGKPGGVSQGGALANVLNDSIGFPLLSTATATGNSVPIGLNIGSETRYFQLHRGRR